MANQEGPLPYDLDDPTPHEALVSDVEPDSETHESDAVNGQPEHDGMDFSDMTQGSPV